MNIKLLGNVGTANFLQSDAIIRRCDIGRGPKRESRRGMRRGPGQETACPYVSVMCSNYSVVPHTHSHPAPDQINTVYTGGDVTPHSNNGHHTHLTTREAMLDKDLERPGCAQIFTSARFFDQQEHRAVFYTPVLK